MDKLKSLFSLKDINNTSIENFFNEIAIELFEHYCIKFGNITYKFLEIECYYWSDKHRDNRADGNTPFVYKRINDTPCAFLSHGSGMDICFKSTDNQYGGILIRALKRIVDGKEKEASVVPGPWDCRDTLINYSGGMIDDSSIEKIKNAYPILTYNKKIDIDVEIKRVPRYGVPKGSAYEHNLYCYYNHKFKSNNNKWGNHEINYPRYIPTTQTKENNNYSNVPWNRPNNNKSVLNTFMIEDKDTNIVYLSKWLKEEHIDFYNRLTALFESLDIKYEILKYTNDYWCRDYMPIQLGENEFVKYRYYPNYLLDKAEDKSTITNCLRACKSIGIQYKETDIIIDGGNVVPCGNVIVMTDKVITENGYSKSNDNSEFVSKLSNVFDKKIILIPWNEHKDDCYGHADGFIKYAGGSNILMSNLMDEYPEEAIIIQRILENNGFNVTHLHFDRNLDHNWAYINFLQLGDKIIMPSFGVKEDEQAMMQIQNLFPYCSIYPIEMSQIAGEGGALHCLTWNIKV